MLLVVKKEVRKVELIDLSSQACNYQGLVIIESSVTHHHPNVTECTTCPSQQILPFEPHLSRCIQPSIIHSIVVPFCQKFHIAIRSTNDVHAKGEKDVNNSYQIDKMTGCDKANSPPIQSNHTSLQRTAHSLLMKLYDPVNNGNIPEEEGGVSSSSIIQRSGVALSRIKAYYLSLILKTTTSPTVKGAVELLRKRISPR